MEVISRRENKERKRNNAGGEQRGKENRDIKRMERKKERKMMEEKRIIQE